jgi:hypothetical protein
MNVHIVYPGPGDPQQSQIIPRLARWLADGTGWSLGIKPDPAADLNYWFPYLLHDARFTRTPVAAWFTHREEGWPEKEAVWRGVGERVDLRTVSTQLYRGDLEKYGRTALVTPPIDPQFRPPKAKVKRASRPVVGVAGYVYASGRKGERLVAQLEHSALGERIELTASGRGWPCGAREHSYAGLPEFYSSLDVLLSASLLEGPGYPPMEALACGTRIVVPRGVGIFDEFPDLPGVHRYERGDFDAMCAALETALATEADPAALSEAMGRYTLEEWVNDHLRAFQELLHPVPTMPDDLPDWRGCAGVYVVAYGDPARHCAEKCIASWHRHMPGVPVCLASDAPLGPEDVFVEEPDADLGARSVKTRVYDLAPQEWRYVLYVDADTEVTADVSFLFDLLADGWEMFICANPAQYVLGRHMVRKDNRDECEETFNLVGTDEFLQMNGGVFGFRRCERTAAFMRRWHDEWLRWGKRDQAAFDRALYSDPLRVYALGVEWNCITRYAGAERSAGIVHRPTLARRWSGIVHERLDSPEAWKQAGLK